MFLEFKNDDEVIKVPILKCSLPNPDLTHYLGGFGTSENNSIIIYEEYSKPWIPEIEITEIPDNGLTKIYKSTKNETFLTLTYAKYNYAHFSGQFVNVKATISNNQYRNIITTRWRYPNQDDGWTITGELFLYDVENKVIPICYSGNNILTDVQNEPGRDYARLSSKYLLWKQNTYLLKAKHYTSASRYFKNQANPNQSTAVYSSDIGSSAFTEMYPSSAGSCGTGGSQIEMQRAYEMIFSNIKISTYPNQNPDGDDDNSGQTPSDPPIPGNGDTSSDPIPNPPAKPTFDVTNTGFVVIYNPSVTEIRQLAYFMWSGDFTDLIKKMFASPFEAIISLKMLFCPITAGSSQTVWLGNVETDVTMAKVTDQFTDVDLGTINVNEFFGSFADYAPFTKIQIYLPFIGFKDLNVDEVMNSQLHLRYRVDVYTGACIAYLTVTKTIKSTNLNSILYQFDGNCAMEIPFTSNDNSRYVAAIMNSVASSALSLANTSGYTMPVAGKGFNQKAIPSTFELGSLAPVANGMLDIMSAKPNVQRAGSLSGAVSAMALKQPYLIIHRPIAQMPADYQKYLGIPLNLTRQLANVTGYTIVSQVFMSSELATDREIAMITEALKNGVIL